MYRHNIPKCSICQTPNVLTKFCPCRRQFLKNVPIKFQSDPLRLEGSPAKLVVDVTIGTDILPAIVDTFNNFSVVNRDMVNYLRMNRKNPGNDNTINVEFKIGFMRFSINCTIKDDAVNLLSLGLSALLNIGVELKLGDTTVRGLPNNNAMNIVRLHNISRPNHRSRGHNRSIYKYDRRQFRQRSSVNYRTTARRPDDPVVITYPPVDGSVNWDDNETISAPTENRGQVTIDPLSLEENPSINEEINRGSGDGVAAVSTLEEAVAVQDPIGAVGDTIEQSQEGTVDVEPMIIETEILVPEREVEDVSRNFQSIELDEDALLADI